MRAADNRVQRVGVNFALAYYTALTQTPAKLSSFYAPTAHLSHCFVKAVGLVEIEATLAGITKEHFTKVVLDEVACTVTTTGNTRVTVNGQFKAAAEPKSFSQEFELRELQAGTFAVVKDTLTYTAAASKTAATETWIEKSPEMKPATPKATPKAAPAPAPVEKKPTTFAEALRMKQTGTTGTMSSSNAIRVMEKPPAKAEEKKERKDKKEEAPAKKEREHVRYDIIIKELPEGTKEADVMEMVKAVAVASLAKVEERGRRVKEGAEKTLPYAFVQLDKAALAEAKMDVKAVVEKLAEQQKEAGLQVEEVRERERKPPASGDRKPRKTPAPAKSAAAKPAAAKK